MRTHIPAELSAQLKQIILHDDEEIQYTSPNPGEYMHILRIFKAEILVGSVYAYMRPGYQMDVLFGNLTGSITPASSVKVASISLLDTARNHHYHDLSDINDRELSRIHRANGNLTHI